ncbi:hypothetical protein PMI15_01577 [Polaromonas sp. CF318]|uniref:hypothetical protein n=1 Tax=Polaromonas sp. CF318 TaxID=1144318 RepID=UPI0002712661|nr:hypothetical protein [Polaromonas sp. CF318]EJL86359.1 hypothetical protein PMI15_01577 [Polaromonas sp. CF318]
MFTAHLRKFDELPYKTLLMVAAGLVILCQLAAMAFVADSQVAKARLRDEQRRAELVVIAHCMETSAGAARHSCIQQARVIATAPPQPAADSVPREPAFAEASSSAGHAMPARPVRPPQGFMAASFAVR